ncbi:aspartic proteinase nepenthesin-1 [Apium graveolens]|uniref:aspartic proteinase nepenthesin-1 n=1 Tax=Apium graveolens TaxID=4045 RepID=UPI003D7BE54F
MGTLSSLIFVTLSLTILLFISPASSTSRRALDKPVQKSGFRVTLRHRDYGKNLTKFELFERAIKRGKNRLHRLNTMSYSKAATTRTTSAAAKSKVHAGSGEYLMEIAIGTPAESYSAILDTGSDLIWTQCKPCEECFDQSTPIFDPSKSSSFSEISCSDKLCSALPTKTCSKSKDACIYLYTYGDQSSTEGALATETFTFGKVSVPKIGFGCGSDNEGSGFSQGAGLVGLGRGPLSLISQMDEPKFSYCLTSIDDESSTSTLFMGSEAKKSDAKMISTPLIKNPSYPSFYYLSLKGITVGDTKLSIDESVFSLNDADGSGGMIIDSGTTITYLEESAFDELKKEFVSQTKLPVDDSGSIGLDVCFKLPSNADSVEVPKLLFNFEGGSLDLPAENYMIADSSMGVVCLAMGSSQGMSIFGNVQQQNMMVLHDLNAQTVSFMPTQCDKL